MQRINIKQSAITIPYIFLALLMSVFLMVASTQVLDARTFFGTGLLSLGIVYCYRTIENAIWRFHK